MQAKDQMESIIYYVEDDCQLKDLVVYALRNHGFEAYGFSDALTFLNACQTVLPQLIVLDVILPDENGLLILKKLRSEIKTSLIPVMLVSIQGTEYDKILGLDTGADDYLTKPFGMMELLSRIRALLRRTKQFPPIHLCVDGLVFNSIKHSVTVNGEPVMLTNREYALLKGLIENPGMIFTRERILNDIWNDTMSSSIYKVNVHIQTLRKKLGDCSRLIETVRGIGYRFKDLHAE